jgi:hypothetical protein
MLYELRAYRVADGRMDEEIARALGTILSEAEGGLGLFARYGVPRPVGMWRALTGPHLPSMLFLYPWESAQQRAGAFETFGADPAWLRYRAVTNAGSEIVDRMDDLLLTGPAPGALAADALFEFTWDTPASDAAVVLGPLTPLCGSRPGPLRVLAHDEAELARLEPREAAERSFCRLVHAWDLAP